MKTGKYNKASLIIAIIAILFSAAGFVLSLILNSIADEANNLVKESAELSIRPYLHATIEKNKESGNYFEIYKTDKGVNWKITVLIENKGNTPANNISIPNNIIIKDLKSLNQDLTVGLGNVVLAQGKKYAYDFVLVGAVKDGVDFEQEFKRLTKNMAPLQFKFIVKYKSLLNDKAYKTTIIFNIKKETVEILDGKYE